jgi:dihydrofolate reductase
MRDLALLTFLTLDGVMQSPGGPEEDPSGGFVKGGWARGCWDEVMAQVMEEAMAEPYDLLLGRTTYEAFAASFANAGDDDPTARKLNSATKFVVTSTLEELIWNNSERVAGDIAAAVAGLKTQDGPLLQVHGSWQLAQTLLANDLVDEFRLWVFPVIAGSGKRLFAGGNSASGLTLLRTRSTPNGAVMSIYMRQ